MGVCKATFYHGRFIIYLEGTLCDVARMDDDHLLWHSGIQVTWVEDIQASKSRPAWFLEWRFVSHDYKKRVISIIITLTTTEPLQCSAVLGHDQSL